MQKSNPNHMGLVRLSIYYIVTPKIKHEDEDSEPTFQMEAAPNVIEIKDEKSSAKTYVDKL